MIFTERYKENYEEDWHEDFSGLYSFAIEVSDKYEEWCVGKNSTCLEWLM